MYIIFALALVVMLGAILGALCRNACTTRVFCGVAFFPLLVFGFEVPPPGPAAPCIPYSPRPAPPPARAAW